MYQLLENGIPCDTTHFKDWHPSWNSSYYNTFEEAKKYAITWTWASVGHAYPNKMKQELIENTPYKICEDKTIEIRKV